jgi:hypothetical protein
MALTGVKDLSVISDKLTSLIEAALTAATPGFAFTVSGSMPESVRNDGSCQVSFYLYHVGVDKTMRNTPVIGPDLVRQRPMGLELYYLLTVFAGKDYVKEQHAISIAMRALYDNPYIRTGGVGEEMTLTMEMEGIEKLGILWQAISAPLRLTAVYKVAVAFLTPSEATPAPAKKPTAFTLVADPAALPFAESGQLAGSYTRITYITPDSTAAQLKAAIFDLSPGTAVPGQEVILYGAGLNRVGTDRVFLLDADGTNERDITAWRAANPALHTGTKIVLNLPPTVGAAPANSPTPGVYQMCVGGGPGVRTNSIPVAIAAAIIGVANPPLLPQAAGLFTFDGVGFLPARTEVLLETVALNEAGAAPAAGEFQIQLGGGSIQFRAPAIMKSGRYPLRVRVNRVESAPSWWVDV